MTQRYERHGATGTKLLHVWRSMRARCSLPSDTNYRHYGARGISVCAEWEASFTKFRAWALAAGYAEGLAIDRIDGRGNYEPTNCRWVTQLVNNRNTRKNTKVKAFGEDRCLSEWAEDPRCAVSYGTLQQRIFHGWRGELALTAPKGSRRLRKSLSADHKAAISAGRRAGDNNPLGSTGVRGVYPARTKGVPNGKFLAVAGHGSKRSLGTFDTVEDARLAREAHLRHTQSAS